MHATCHELYYQLRLIEQLRIMIEKKDTAMRVSSAILAMALSLGLNGCATPSHSPTQLASNFIHNEQIVHTTPDTFPAKNPNQVAIYSHEKIPSTPYRVIGVATVSRHNLFGIQRADASLQNRIKEIAAALGGDGVININNNTEHMQASIIQFQKILI